MMWLVNTVGFKIHGETTRVDKSYLIFNDFFELPIHQESEIIVPYKHSREVVETIRDVVLTNKFPVNYITEVCTCTYMIVCVCVCVCVQTLKCACLHMELEIRKDNTYMTIIPITL